MTEGNCVDLREIAFYNSAHKEENEIAERRIAEKTDSEKKEGFK